MEKKILILKSEHDSFEKYYSKRMHCTNIDVQAVYKFHSGIFRIASILWIQYLKLPFKHIWYGKWKKNLNKYDQIIVFDRIFGYEVLEYIHKHNSKARIIFWYWNIALNMIPDKYRKYCEIWSFDDEDCIKYDFKKNIQFYFEPDKKASNIKYDAVFIGKDKGRYEQIKKLYDYLSEKDMKLNFNVVGSVHKDEICVENVIDYENVIKMIESTKCIVEFTQKDQVGMSARALEALFYQKKLITNNAKIRSEKMYSKDNIFILGEDNMENLVQFIETPYVSINDDLRKEYLYDTWIEKFD